MTRMLCCQRYHRPLSGVNIPRFMPYSKPDDGAPMFSLRNRKHVPCFYRVLVSPN